MGIGKQVADAYIEVHGDLSKFRKDLNGANASMKSWAEDMADEFGKAWGDRTRSQMDRQWNSVIDMMHSGKKVDFNRMIDEFDPTDIENSFRKINDMLDVLRKNEKITVDEMGEVRNAIEKQMEAIKKQEELEVQQTAARNLRSRAYRDMLKDEAKAKEDQLKTFAEAFAENARFDALRRKNAKIAEAEIKRQGDLHRLTIKNMTESHERWKRSFGGMLTMAKEFDLDRKFKDLTQAMATNDWSSISRGANNMRDLRNQTMATATEMRKLGRMTDAEFKGVEAQLTKVSMNMRRFNVSFGSVNKASSKHARDWKIIEKSVGNAVAKFKGFSGLNVVGDIFRDGAQFFQDLDRNAVKLGKMALMVGTVGSAVVNMIGGIAVVGQDLAKIGQISILGPAFLTGAAIGAGVLIAALKDMGDVLGDLKPRFEELQNSISTSFWNVAEQPIRNLVDTLLPTLSTKLTETSAVLGGMFAALADSLASISTDDISTMFDRMNEGITNATGAMDPLVQAFNTMGMVGSEYFARFGTWITDISTQFNNFIQAAAADGRLNTWIEEAITAIQDAWSILGSAIGIFNAIGNAAEAAGIGGLGVLADNLEKVSEIMNSDGFQSTLTQLFEGAAGATRAVGTAILELGPAIQSFMPTLTAALGTIGDTVATVIGYIGEVLSNPVVQQGLSDFLQGVQYGVSQLGPAIGPMADSLGQVGTLLGVVAGLVGELVAAMAVNLSPVLDQVTGAFSRITFAAGPEIISIIETASSVLQGFVDVLLPPLEKIIMSILPLIGPAFEALVPVFEAIQGALAPFLERIQQLVDIIAPVLVPAIEKIAAALTPVIEVIGIVVDAIMSVLVPILGVLLVGAINSVVGVFEGFSTFVMSAVEMIVGVFNGFRDIFVGIFTGDFGMALDGLKQVFGSIWDGIIGMLSGALEFAWNLVNLIFIGKLVGGIKTALTSVGAFFKTSWDEIGVTIMGAMQKILSLVTAGLQAVLKFITTVLTSVLNFFKSIWTNIGSAVSTALSNMRIAVSGGMAGVKSLITAALNHVKAFFVSSWNSILGTIKSVLGSIKTSISGGMDAAKRVITGALDAMKTFFTSGFTGMATATSTGISNVMTFITGIPGKISGALSGLGSLLWNAGSSIINGLKDGIVSAFEGVKEFVGGIASWIADHKGPISYDKVLLIPAGNAIMDGLGKGLRDKLGMLKSTLETVTDTMTDTVTDAFAKNKMYLAGADAALGLADGLKSKKSAVASALTAVMPSASASVSASLIRTPGTSRAAGPEVSGPQAAGVVIEAGAIVVQTPTKDPEIVAEKVIDGFANYSNL